MRAESPLGFKDPHCSCSSAEMYKSLIFRLSVLLSAAHLAGCVTYDPKYLEFEQRADRNPPPSAIVGMWHKPNPPQSALFTSDGKLYWKAAVGIGHLIDPNYLPPPMAYEYEGNGVWTLGKDKSWKFKVSGDYLLVSTSGLINQVFDRVPEKAGGVNLPSQSR